VLEFALVIGLIMGTPVALSGIGAPPATAGLRLFVDVATAEVVADCSPVGFAVCTPTNVENKSKGGDPTSSSRNGGPGGPSRLTTLHDLVTQTAALETSQSLSDAQTSDISQDVTIVIEDTDETVVINMAGNPGSSGIHMMNAGAVPQATNTGGTDIVSSGPLARQQQHALRFW